MEKELEVSQAQSAQELTVLNARAAQACQQFAAAVAVNIQGRRYLPVEAWQSIATAHGCTLSSEDAVREYDNHGELIGWKARGSVVRIVDGKTISFAEGYVGREEKKWGHERTPEYACRAMAQTRAMSRAARSAFAHVVIMMKQGFAVTPAEEMDGLQNGEVQTEDGSDQQTPQKPAGLSWVDWIKNELKKDQPDYAFLRKTVESVQIKMSEAQRKYARDLIANREAQG